MLSFFYSPLTGELPIDQERDPPDKLVRKALTENAKLHIINRRASIVNYIETNGNTKLRLITEESDPGIWNSSTNNGIWWEHYGDTMGNDRKELIAAEHAGTIYPLFTTFSMSSGDISRPIHPIDAGGANEMIEAEVIDGKIYLLYEPGRGNQHGGYWVSKFTLENQELTSYELGKTSGTSTLLYTPNADYAARKFVDIGLESDWNEFQEKYNFFETFGGVSEKTDNPSDSKNSNDIDEIIGTSSNDKLKGKKVSVSLFGYKGNDKLIGSKKDDILDGGEGNDKLKGGRGADVYILSSGKDKFIGFKLQEGDTIEIDRSIDFQVSSSKKDAKIIHEEGLTVVKKISASDLESAIEIV